MEPQNESVTFIRCETTFAFLKYSKVSEELGKHEKTLKKTPCFITYMLYVGDRDDLNEISKCVSH